MDTILTIILWGGLFFLMMRFGCGSHMFGQKHDEHDENSPGKASESHGGGGCCKPSKKKTDAVTSEPDIAVITNDNENLNSDEAPWSPPTEDTDPICGKTVKTAQAKSCERGGLVYYFCSSQCRDEFESLPHE